MVNSLCPELPKTMWLILSRYAGRPRLVSSIWAMENEIVGGGPGPNWRDAECMSSFVRGQGKILRTAVGGPI